MPAFTFEKISPEKASPHAHRGPAAAIEKKRRGVMFQILDRLAEARAKRTRRGDDSTIARRKQTPQD